MRVLLVVAGCFASGMVAGYGKYTVEIPAQSMLVKKGSTNAADIVASGPVNG